MRKSRLTPTALVPLAAFFIGCHDQPTDPPEPSFAKGGGQGSGSVIMVEFKRPESGEVEDFFTAGQTMDFVSEAQPVDGRHRMTSIDTKYSPFTLTFEPKADLFDGKDPENDEVCETDWLVNEILSAAAANGGWLKGLLKITADWDQRNFGDRVFAQFIVTVDPNEYEITIPMPASPAQDTRVQDSADGTHTILAIRDGHFQIRWREVGQTGTWWGLQRCLVSGSNGIMDFEIWVSK